MLIDAPGPKTIVMMQELNRGALHRYLVKKKLFVHEKTQYQVLTGAFEAFSEKPSVYIGSSPTGREIISLLPGQCPQLEKRYEELLAYLSEHSSIEENLKTLTLFIKEKIFDPKISLEENLYTLLYQWEKSHPLNDFTPTSEGFLIPVIPLDDFITLRLGVCRHHAFAGCYLLHRLLKETSLFPQGAVHLVRDVVETSSLQGGHGWMVYISENGQEKWHIDPYWGALANLSSPDEVELLRNSYGKDAINTEIQRFCH